MLFSVAVAACGGSNEDGAESTGTPSKPIAAVDGDNEAASAAKTAPRAPYPRMLPLELVAPPAAQAGVPLAGVSVNLSNPGPEAPDARLRLTIHYEDHREGGDHRELTSDNVKIEVQEGESWKPVLLGMVGGGVMGAIGTEGVAAHQERHRRGGFSLPAGSTKTWQLRITFGLPGTYTLVSVVSPDNGSRHLAQPAHSTIVVQ